MYSWTIITVANFPRTKHGPTCRRVSSSRNYYTLLRTTQRTVQLAGSPVHPVDFGARVVRFLALSSVPSLPFPPSLASACATLNPLRSLSRTTARSNAWRQGPATVPTWSPWLNALLINRFIVWQKEEKKYSNHSNYKTFDFSNIKFNHKISILLSRLGLSIKVLQEWLQFDCVCIFFFETRLVAP